MDIVPDSATLFICQNNLKGGTKMYTISNLDDVRGNTVAVYSIKTLLSKKMFPKLSIMSGMMGVGKTSIANVVAKSLDETDSPVKTYNFGLKLDMAAIREEVFSLSPAKSKAFIFEEIHALPESDQNALLQMFDTQPANVYVICTTTELNKVIRTIQSRAQVWEFKLLSEKQLRQLLDDYLKSQNVDFNEQSKQALLKSSHGVPRDLIKNADFAIAGQFDEIQLDTLLGNVSDANLFTMFCALCSNPVDCVNYLRDILENPSWNLINAMNDFWVRYILESKSGVLQTFSKEMITTLNSLYTQESIVKVGKLLTRVRPKNLLLELLMLNMSLQSVSNKTVLGIQKDVSIQEAGRIQHKEQTQHIEMKSNQSAKLTVDSIEELKLT